MDSKQKELRATEDGVGAPQIRPSAGASIQAGTGAGRPTYRSAQARFSRRPPALALSLSVLALVMPAARGGLMYTNLVSFVGTNGDSPIGTLVQGRDGNLYGVTQMGGAFGGGTVFKLVRDGTLTTLASFDITNGCGPHAGLVQGSDGSFYGTETFGGVYTDQAGLGCGAVFKITPEGLLTNLALLNETNGAHPSAELVEGTDGSFYGTTTDGGQYGYGTAFKVTPAGEFTCLVSFNLSSTSGYQPWGPLSPGDNGSFYGTTRAGGSCGCGSLFQMTPEGALDTLVSFSCTNGVGSMFALVRGADGSWYGAGDGGGAYGLGMIYRVTPKGEVSTTASFSGTNGELPRGLTQAADGNFYGMTAYGGIGYNGQMFSGYGTIFEATPAGVITSLISFTNDDWAFGGLLQANDGSFYGMTRHGGDYGHGRVFRLSVPMAPVCRVMAQAGNTVSLTWSAVAGQTYQVQFSTNLGQTNWLNLGSPVTATDGTAAASAVIESDPQRLYRVVLLP